MLINKKNIKEAKKEVVLNNLSDWSLSGNIDGGGVYYKGNEEDAYFINGGGLDIEEVFLKEIKQNPQDWKVVGTKEFEERPEWQGGYFLHQVIKHKSGRTHYTPLHHKYWGFRGVDWWKEVFKLIDGASNPPKSVLTDNLDNETDNNNEDVSIDNLPKSPQTEVKDEPIDYSTWTKEQLIIKVKELEETIKQLEQNSPSKDKVVSEKKEELKLVQNRLGEIINQPQQEQIKEPASGTDYKVVVGVSIVIAVLVVMIGYWFWNKKIKN